MASGRSETANLFVLVADALDVCLAMRMGESGVLETGRPINLERGMLVKNRLALLEGVAARSD